MMKNKKIESSRSILYNYFDISGGGANFIGSITLVHRVKYISDEIFKKDLEVEYKYYPSLGKKYDTVEDITLLRVDTTNGKLHTNIFYKSSALNAFVTLGKYNFYNMNINLNKTNG